MSRVFEFTIPNLHCNACISDLPGAIKRRWEKEYASKIHILIEPEIIGKIQITIDDDPIPGIDIRQKLKSYIDKKREQFGRAECYESKKNDQHKKNSHSHKHKHKHKHKHEHKVKAAPTGGVGSINGDHDAACHLHAHDHHTHDRHTHDHGHAHPDEHHPEHSLPDREEEDKKKTLRNHLIKGITGTTVGLGLIALMLSGLAIPTAVMIALMAGSSLLTLALGWSTYKSAFNQLFREKDKKLSHDALYAISTLTIVGVGIASFFVPWLPMMMMESGVLIFGLKELSEAAEASIRKRVSTGLTQADKAAKKVWRLKPGLSWDEARPPTAADFEKCKASDVQPGDIIKLTSGKVIPVDGTCITAIPSINHSIVDGNEDKSLAPGEKILAGMEVPLSVPDILFKVDRTVPNSFLQQSLIRRINASADQEKAATLEKTTDKYLKFFIPAVIGLAIVSGLVVGTLFTPALGIICAVSVLVSACPCTLMYATKTPPTKGITKAAEKGVLFANGQSLEEANSIDTVVFDLNRTLTTGKPKMVSYQNDSRLTDNQFLTMIAALEEKAITPGAKARHPVAQAIYDYANTTTRNQLLNINNFVTTRTGVKATVNGEVVLIGNLQFLKENGLHSIPEVAVGAHEGIQITYVVINDQVVGHLKIKEPLRDEARFVVNELKREGKEVHICTGADEKTAEHYAKELGIPKTHIYANCNSGHNSRKTKVDYIQHLKAQGKRVAMVGDAGNDTDAVAASYGIAVNSRDVDLTNEARAVIEKDSLLPVLTAFTVAKETIRGIKQNLFGSLGFNVAVMLITGGLLVGLGFVLNPAIGVALMFAEGAIVTANIYRINKQALPYENRWELEHAKMKAREAGIPEAQKQKITDQLQLLRQEAINTKPNSRARAILVNKIAALQALLDISKTEAGKESETAVSLKTYFDELPTRFPLAKVGFRDPVRQLLDEIDKQPPPVIPPATGLSEPQKQNIQALIQALDKEAVAATPDSRQREIKNQKKLALKALLTEGDSGEAVENYFKKLPQRYPLATRGFFQNRVGTLLHEVHTHCLPRRTAR
jgi:Cu2+-exporting ATPase